LSLQTKSYKLLAANFSTFVGIISAIVVTITEVAFWNASLRIWTHAATGWAFNER